MPRREYSDDNYRDQRDEGRPLNIIESTPPRTLGGWLTGAVGAFVGMFAGDTVVKSKMLEFDTDVSNLVRDDILNRKGGAGAGIDSGAAAVVEHPMPMGGFGPGAGSHAIREAHELNLIKSGKYPFARFIKVVGSMPITLGAAAIGGLGAMGAYFAVAPKKDTSRPEPEDMPRSAVGPSGLPEMYDNLLYSRNAESKPGNGQESPIIKADKAISTSDILDEIMKSPPEKRGEMMENWARKQAEAAIGEKWKARVDDGKEATPER